MSSPPLNLKNPFGCFEICGMKEMGSALTSLNTTVHGYQYYIIGVVCLFALLAFMVILAIGQHMFYAYKRGKKHSVNDHLNFTSSSLHHNGSD